MSLFTHNSRLQARSSKLTSRSSSSGTTLLEFLIYVGMIGVLLSTVTLFAVEMTHAQAKAAALAQAVREARFAASRLEIEIREASDVNTGSSTYGSHPGTLSLATATPATDPTVFAVSAGALTVQQGSGPVLPLTSPKVEVQEFIVENVGSPNKTRAIRIHLKVAAKNAGGLVEQKAETVIESTARIHAKDGFGN